MAEQRDETHRHHPALWLVAFLSAVIGFALAAGVAWRQRDAGSVALLLTAFTVLCVVLIVRRSAIRLQDRIIRLEMQTRLARLGHGAEFAKLSLPQIIALRFASDAELPALINRALGENLTSDQIKRAVTQWQADYLRS